MVEIMQPSEYLEKQLNFRLSSDIADSINRETCIVTFQSGYTVLHENEKASKLYFILLGVVRGYYIDKQGNDVTKCFSMENEFFSTEALRSDGLSSFTIECLEECQCIQFSYNLINRIMNKDAQLKDWVNQYYLREVVKLEKRTKSLILMSAEERYYDFCKEYPNLHSRIALKYIASYIGIRAASLSRIRKNFKEGN